MTDKAAIIKEAQRYIARGQIDKAISEWEKLIKEYPDGNTFNTIGDLYLKKGCKTEAIDSFHKAADYFRREGFSLKALALYKKILNIAPADPRSLIALAELNEGKGLVTDAIKFYLAAADSLSKDGKKEQILEIYEKILALSPSNIPLRVKVSEIYKKEGLLSEASKQYMIVARLLAERDEPERALEFFQKVLDSEPLNREVIFEVSSLYERKGDFDNAMEHLMEAAGLFPQDTDILIKCAELNISNNRLDGAREYLAAVAEIEPANIKARRLLGDIYVREGDKGKAWVEYLPILDDMLLEENYDDAIRILNSFRDIDPVETGRRLVSLYSQLGDSQQVIQHLTALGDIFIDRDKPREALNCFKEAHKMSPEDDMLRNRVIEIERQIGKEHIVTGAEKTFEEAIIDADIYLRYRLHENARDILETFREKFPDNIDIHLRLKSLYLDMGDKDRAVTECLILSELYGKSGESEQGSQMIRYAREINPEDQRLAEIAGIHEPGEDIAVPPDDASEGPSIEDYSEEIAEADFYSRQGLIDEAREILERLQTLFPENADIALKLNSVSQVVEDAPHSDETQMEAIAGEGEILEAEEIAEPSLDSDVMDIFNEFKKGIEKELAEEDYETHYNLGIAYKEMGLIDDAIKEFQTSRKDPRRFVHSSTMLGLCYVEKNLYPLAIEVLRDAIGKMQDSDESYWAMKYELAEAYEKNGNLKEAVDYFTQVYGWNSKFRSVSDKINNLRAGMVDSTEQKKTKERKDRVSYL
jgi:tetratricopeptide (TPR) repeat protein